MKFTYCNTDTKAVSKDISVLFPGFGKDEVLILQFGAFFCICCTCSSGTGVAVPIQSR